MYEMLGTEAGTTGKAQVDDDCMVDNDGDVEDNDGDVEDNGGDVKEGGNGGNHEVDALLCGGKSKALENQKQCKTLRLRRFGR